MSEISARVSELDAHKGRPIVVHCHHGGRSLRVTNWLRQFGFQAQNIRQFSVRPERYKDTRPEKSELRGIYNAMTDLAGRVAGGPRGPSRRRRS